MRFRPLAAVAACACLLVLPAFAGAEIKLAPTGGSPITGTGPGGILEAADFNGDGLDDLAIGNFTGSGEAVRIRLANPDDNWTTMPGLLPNANSSNLVAADFNDDDKQDLLITEFDPDNYPGGGDTFRVLLGNGDGTFQAPKTIDTGGTVSTSITGQAIEAADLTHDGKVDLFMVLFDNRVALAAGQGDGTFDFDSAVIPEAPTGSFEGFTTVAIGDFNGDGLNDFALGLAGGQSPTAENTGLIVLYGGSGAGRLPVSPLGAVIRMIEKDINQDGFDDLIVMTVPSASGGKPVELVAFAGSEDGLSETSAPLFTLPAGNPNLVATDFDLDDRTDLAWIEEAAAEPAGFTSALAIAGGDEGTFNRQDGFFDLGFSANQGSAAHLTTGDFNGDGSPDVASSFFSSDCATQGCGTVVLSSRASVSIEPGTLAFGTVTRGSNPDPKTFTITNSGSAPASLTTFVTTGTEPNRFPLGGQCQEIAPGENCTVTVDIDTSTAGEFNSTFIYSFDGVPGDFRAQASGKVVYYHGQIDRSSIDFGSIRVGDAPLTQQVTVTADGNDGLTLGQLSIGGAGATSFAIAGDTCSGKTLASGATCSFGVSTAVKSAGQLAATINLPSNGSETASSIPVSANALPALTYRATLKLTGPKTAKAGKKFKVTARTSNTGTGSLSGMVLKWKATQAGKTKASKTIKLATILPGKKSNKVITIAIPKKKLAKGKPIRITATLTRQGKAMANKSISVRIRG